MKNNEPFIMCDRCKRLYRSLAVAQCNHTAVNQHYGNHICMYCCRKCKHHTTTPYFGGVGCELRNGGKNHG